MACRRQGDRIGCCLVSTPTSFRRRPSWRARVGAATGIPIGIVSSVDAGVELGELLEARGTIGLARQAFQWFAENLSVSEYLLGDALESTVEKATHVTRAAIDKLGDVILLWMQRAPLVELERQLKPTQTLGVCTEARKFVRRSIPEISYAIGVIVQLLREREQSNLQFQMSLDIATVAACIRQGGRQPRAPRRPLCRATRLTTRSPREALEGFS